MEPLIYIILLIIEAILLYNSGRLILRSKSKKQVVLSSFLGIFAYTLNEGLRWGRGVDYNLYYYGYYDIIKGYESSLEYLYQMVCKILGYFGADWQIMVALMSFILILSVYKFLDNFKLVLPYALPAFAFFCIQAETLMRWYLAFSFILISISIYLKSGVNKKWQILIYCLIGVGFHNAISIVIPFFYLILLIKKPIIKPIYAVIIYLLIGFLFSTEIMTNFSTYMNLFTFGIRFEHYQANADYWLTRGYVEGETDAFENLKFSLFWIVLVYLGYKICQVENVNYTRIYNLFVLGFILNPAYHQIELLNRYGQLFLLFQFLIVAYVIKYFVVEKLIKIPKLVLLLCVLIMLNYSRQIFVYPFFDKTDHYLYIWDRNGRETLDVSTYFE